MCLNRLNLGKIRREENILWSFAPHDVSVILGLLGDMPVEADAVGATRPIALIGIAEKGYATYELSVSEDPG